MKRMASEQEIITELEAPFKSFRLFALEQAIAKGAGRELLQALNRLQRTETDSECLNLFPYAIEAVQRRFDGEGTAPVSLSQITSQTFPELFRASPPGKQLQLLLGLPPKLVPELISWARETLGKNPEPPITAQLLRTFGRSWPVGEVKSLIGPLFGRFISVRMAALESITHVSPHHLADHFPALLQDSDPRIVAAGVQGLACIDAEEAEKHIQSELLGRNSARKLAILKVAVVMPFALVKEPLLKFLSAENDPGLIEKGGLPLQINPDPEVPYRLLEIVHQADSRKAALLREIFKGSCQIISDSGLLGDGFSAFLAKVETASERLGLVKSLHRAVSDLNSEDESAREEGESVLLREKENPVLGEILEKSRGAPFSADQKKQVVELLAKKAQTQVLPGGAVSWELKDFLILTGENQSRWLARIRPGDKEKAAPFLQGVLKEEKTTAQVKAVALRAALRLELGQFRESAARWVNRAEESLVVASLEYLARFDPEKTLPMLGLFHKSPNPRIRIAAMKILWFQDPERAVSSLLAILKNPNPRTRSSAFSCLMGFDFALIRESIVDFLETSRDVVVLETILLLFQNNPAIENLFLLFRLEKTFSGDVAQKIRAVREENRQMIEAMRLLEKAELKKLEDSFPGKWQAMKSRKSALPAYAVEKLKAAQAGSWNREQFVRETLPQLLILAGVGLVLFAVVWFGVGALLGPDSVKKVASGGILAVPMAIEGIVTNLATEEKNVVIVTTDHVTFKVRIPAGANFALGEKIKAFVKPIRKGDGCTFARFVSIEKL